MAIQKQIWANFIEGNLFKNNPHLTRCKREDEFVLAGSIVHIPMAGAKPVVVKNRNTFPAIAVERTDSDIVYLLDNYTTDPTRVRNAEEAEISYSKMMSVYGEHILSLGEYIGDEIIVKWLASVTNANAGLTASAPAVIRTLGANTAAHMPGATGTRKLFTKESLKAARTLLNKTNQSNERRVCLISSDLLSQLQDDSTLQARDMAKELDMANGVIARLYGFDIIERSTTATFDNATTPLVKSLSAATAVSDNDVAICYQEEAVAMALGNINVFEKTNDPEHYGDVISSEVRMGGRRRRADAAGIISIVQSA